MKRAFDFTVALVALVVLSPLLACLALLVLVTMGRPVFFVQERPGLCERPFKLIKFRTMRSMAVEPLTDGARLTAVGRFLRSTSLDELPELWNVVRGDMSLVGPRPLLMEYLTRYSREQARRHEVRPGITGLAQVNGRNAISWEQRFCLDVWYVDNRTIWLDLRILLTTIQKVVIREGISAAGEATMHSFQGSGSARRDDGMHDT
jgi:lipopolysaccharide/colanic/teichoic acid biosynthesis glycosyltransferase